MHGHAGLVHALEPRRDVDIVLLCSTAPMPSRPPWMLLALVRPHTFPRWLRPRAPPDRPVRADTNGREIDGAPRTGLRVLSLGVHRTGRNVAVMPARNLASRRHGLPSLLSSCTARIRNATRRKSMVPKRRAAPAQLPSVRNSLECILQYRRGSDLLRAIIGGNRSRPSCGEDPSTLIVAIASLLAATMTAHAQAPIQIGVLEPMTGPANKNGVENYTAMVIARDMINERGGVNGRKVEFLLADMSRPDRRDQRDRAADHQGRREDDARLGPFAACDPGQPDQPSAMGCSTGRRRGPPKSSPGAGSSTPSRSAAAGIATAMRRSISRSRS